MRAALEIPIQHNVIIGCGMYLRLSDTIALWQYVPSLFRREALHTWKKRNGSNATYSKLIKIFEQAGSKKYADKVRKISELSESEEDSSSSGEEHSQMDQPQTYPTQKPQTLSQVPPATAVESTKVYVVMEGKENLKEG